MTDLNASNQLNHLIIPYSTDDALQVNAISNEYAAITFPAKNVTDSEDFNQRMAALIVLEDQGTILFQALWSTLKQCWPCVPEMLGFTQQKSIQNRDKTGRKVSQNFGAEVSVLQVPPLRGWKHLSGITSHRMGTALVWFKCFLLFVHGQECWMVEIFGR